MRFGGIVLCGGKSSRMGTSKAALPFGPERMLERIVRILRSVVSPIVVVTAPRQKLNAYVDQVIWACDEREGQGPLEGIHVGLNAIRGEADAAYITSCDVPLLLPQFIRRMLESLGDGDIAVPVEGDFHHPLAGVYRTSVAQIAADMVAASRLRPVYLFDQVRTVRVDVEELRKVDPQLQSLQNLNSPEDYRAALRAASLET